MNMCLKVLNFLEKKKRKKAEIVKVENLFNPVYNSYLIKINQVSNSANAHQFRGVACIAHIAEQILVLCNFKSYKLLVQFQLTH